jgi:hypothetical protein
MTNELLQLIFGYDYFIHIDKYPRCENLKFLEKNWKIFFLHLRKKIYLKTIFGKSITSDNCPPFFGTKYPLCKAKYGKGGGQGPVINWLIRT